MFTFPQSFKEEGKVFSKTALDREERSFRMDLQCHSQNCLTTANSDMQWSQIHAFKNGPWHFMLYNHKLLRTRKVMDNSTFIHFFPAWNPQTASHRQELVIRRMPAISQTHKQLCPSWNRCCILISQPHTWKKCHLTCSTEKEQDQGLTDNFINRWKHQHFWIEHWMAVPTL